MRPVSSYVDRSELHDLIKEQLHDRLEQTGLDAKILIVWGLGGAGKSQLVSKYLQEYRNDYSATFWVEAGQKESLERDFLQIYQSLYGLKERHGEDAVKIDDAVLGVKDWFYGRSGRWLLVFDSADSIDDEDDPAFIDLKHFLPNASSVHIIITTTSSKAKGMTSLPPIQVGSMMVSEAVELFSTCSGYDSTTDQAKIEMIEMIVQELGCLALAITLAGSYVSETHLELDKYLEEFRHRRKEMLDEKAENLVHGYSKSVLATWESSFRAITKRSVNASRLLMLLAFIHYDDIRLNLFERAMKSTPKDEHKENGSANKLLWQSTVFSKDLIDIPMIREAFRVLESFSFIQWRKDQRSYAMHRLVHACTYESLDRESQGTFCTAALGLLAAVLRYWPAEPENKARLIPHLMANFSSVSTVYRIMNDDDKPILDPLGRIGMFLDATGRWTETYAVIAFQFSQMEKLYGKKHPDTLISMKNLANVLSSQGRYEEAEEMHRQALALMEMVLGKKHPDTLISMNNLAMVLSSRGKDQEAEEMHRQALVLKETVLGKKHPSTLTSMNNLAEVLSSRGKVQEAEEMHRQALALTD